MNKGELGFRLYSIMQALISKNDLILNVCVLEHISLSKSSQSLTFVYFLFLFGELKKSRAEMSPGKKAIEIIVFTASEFESLARFTVGLLA